MPEELNLNLPEQNLNDGNQPADKKPGPLIGLLIIAALIVGILSTQPAAAPQNNLPAGTNELAHEQEKVSRQGLKMIFADLPSAIDVNEPVALQFSITDSADAKLSDFEVDHERVLHLIIARKDLRYFYHVHPRFNTNTATFIQNFSFPTAGEWRLFVDVSPRNIGRTILSSDLTVQGPYTPRALNAETAYNQEFDDTLVELTFRAPLQAGQPTALLFALKNPATQEVYSDIDKYLGAMGHTVILKETTLEFAHVHAAETLNSQNQAAFETTFLAAGRYRVFSQFMRRGKIITSFYTVDVK